MAHSLEEQKAELIGVLDASRRELAGDIGEVTTALNFSRQVSSSLVHDRPKWILGAAVVSVIGGVWLFGRSRRPKRDNGGTSRRHPVNQLLLDVAGRALLAVLTQPDLMRAARDNVDRWLKGAMQKR